MEKHSSILPCPWCGGDPWEVVYGPIYSCVDGGDASGFYTVGCENCERGVTASDDEKAIEAWNAIPRPEPWLDAPVEGWKDWWVRFPHEDDIYFLELYSMDCELYPTTTSSHIFYEMDLIDKPVHEWDTKAQYQRAHVPQLPEATDETE